MSTSAPSHPLSQRSPLPPSSRPSSSRPSGAAASGAAAEGSTRPGRRSQPAHGEHRPHSKWRERLVNIGSLLKETGTQWSDDEAARLAASLALYTLLSIAPLLVIA